MRARAAGSCATLLRAPPKPSCTCHHSQNSPASSSASSSLSPSASTSRASYSTAAASAASESPAPALDFLYPGFGFFSRHLPPILPPHEDVGAILGNGGRSWSARSARARCHCLRLPGSCLRCRPASTSAQPPATHRSILDNEEERLISSTTHSHTSDQPSSAAPPPAIVDFASLRDRIDSLSRALPKAHYILPPAHTLRPTQAAAVLASKLGTLEAELEQLWTALEPIVSGQVGFAELTSTEQLDLTRLFARALDMYPVPAQPSPLHEEAQMKELLLRAEEAKVRRYAAAARMSKLIATFVPDPKAEVEHGRSWALLRLETMCLADDLPHSLPSRPSTATPLSELSQLEADLLRIFPHPTTAPSPNPNSPPTKLSPRVLKAQWSAFSALLSAWDRTKAGPAQAVRFVPAWGVDSLLRSPTARALPERRVDLQTQSGLSDLFRRKYGEIVGQLQPSPTGWLVVELEQALERGANPIPLYRTGLHLIEHLANTTGALEAYKLRHLISRHSTDNFVLSKADELRVLTVLVRGLTYARLEHDATALGRNLEAIIEHMVEAITRTPNTKHEKLVIDGYRALAKLAAARGRRGKVDRVLAALEQIGWDAGTEGVARRMRAAAHQLDLDEVVRHYDRAEKMYPNATPKQKGQLGTQLVWAQVRMDDVEGAIRTLATLIRTDTQPPLALIVNLLFGLVRRKKASETYDLFERLPDFGLEPNAICFLALASLHGNLGEPEAVQRVMVDMLALGMEPDSRVWTTLMSAYVNLGQWTDALDVYAFLEQHPNKRMRPDTAAVNVLLKATVLSGAPAFSSLRVFKQAVAQGVRPNAQTYTLVLQALSNAGLMDLAEELFTLMDSPEVGLEESPLPVSMTACRPDVFVFSTMIKGYLERRDAVKAQACLQEMRARGIDPTSITYGIIVGSLVKDKTEVGIKRAQELATTFMSADPDLALLRRHTRPVTFDKPFAAGEEALNVVGPILNALAKKADADKALTIFRHALNERSRPSVLLYTSLMDAYRRADSPENVELIWHRLHRLYVETYPGPPTAREVELEAMGARPRPKIAPSHATGLCHALSVFLDAHLGRDHITTVKSVWRRMAKQGFAFDAGNWNALALALLYAGEVSHAFRVIENVLCRPENASEVEWDITWLRFGKPDRVESALQTNARLFNLRQPELDAHRKRPTSVQELLTVPMQDEVGADSSVSLGDEGKAEIEKARAVRLASYWFPHGVVLEAIERALALLPAEEGGVEFRERLERDHPRTMEAIRVRRAVRERRAAGATGPVGQNMGEPVA